MIFVVSEKVDLNDVALFVQVVRAVSFSRAATAAGSPVSTLSRRVARLEARLGMRLLERTTRRLRLTDAGRRFFEHAERALSELEQGQKYLHALDAEPRGRVRITAPIGLGEPVTTALAPYLAATPGVSVELDLTERRVDLLAEGFDIALRAGEDDTPDYAAKRIGDATRGLYASKAYLDRRGRPRRVADLAGHDLVATRATSAGAVWELFEGKRRLRHVFEPRLLVNELAAARNAAIQGAGIAFLPPAKVAGLERVLPGVQGAPGGFHLLYPLPRRMTAAVRSCAEHLLEHLSHP